MINKTDLGVAVIGAGLALACSGAPKPTQQLANTQAALRAAQEVGAEGVPQAELHTTLAKEQLKRADKLIEDGDNAEAARVLARAKADAELALVLARRAEAQTALDNVKTETPQTSQMSLQNQPRPSAGETP
ncbi:MAG TPA: DUF4398 domain-containing protein [Polyangiales bacterium]|nr:DUF4398 domain-containing protein [Polyangiales bacterium]